MRPKTAQGVRLSVQEGLCIESRPEPCGVVIFGASGDLTERKLFPSLDHLASKKLLPKGFYVVGVARSPMSQAVFRKKSKRLKCLRYLRGDYSDPSTYKALQELLAGLDKEHKTRGNVLFYLALPPSLYAEVPRRLEEGCLLSGACKGGWSRVIIEKPFGRDLESARKLDEELKKHLREEQTYRIDHYLGKETVQNILMFRFANSIFEPVWNRQHIDHVQISVLETLGVEHRAGYYDRSGVLRDMFQNHMMQLLALTAMEPPASFDADRVRDEKIRVFRSLKPLDRGRVVLGQYEGYRKEKGVAAGSVTPTYAAMAVEVDSRRFKGVPFYLRTGKKLGKRAAEIAVTFKRVPHSVFGPLKPSDLAANVLVLRIQPDEGISLTIEAKKPGPKLCMGALTMDFDYSEVFGESPPEAYQRLLLDCMQGDPTLFLRRDAVEETWKYFQAVLDARDIPLHPYRKGSWGPEAADKLLDSDGRSWRTP